MSGTDNSQLNEQGTGQEGQNTDDTNSDAVEGQKVYEAVGEFVQETITDATEFLFGKDDDPLDKGWVGSLESSEKKAAHSAWHARNSKNYSNYFKNSFQSHHYPQEILSASQPNAVAFYIMVRRNSLAARKDVRGTNDISFQFAKNDYREIIDLHPDSEFSTQQNRSSADHAGHTRLMGAGGMLAGLGAGLAAARGKGSVLGKLAKVAGATVAGGILGRGASKLMKEDNSTTFLNSAIHLHVPQSIISAYQADWQSEELGIAGALTNRRFNQIDASEIVELAGRGIIAGAADIPRSAGLGNANVGGAIEAQSKKLNNPFKEQLFKSIGFRKFAFQYQFSPKNESELQNVEEIIKLFKYHMHPELTPGNSFLTYPSEFAIQFLHYDPSEGFVVSNEHLPKISSCALTDVKITYGPDGSFQTIKDTLGAPSEITMELSFTELETLTANRIAAGY